MKTRSLGAHPERRGDEGLVRSSLGGQDLSGRLSFVVRGQLSVRGPWLGSSLLIAQDLIALGPSRKTLRRSEFARAGIGFP
jgi:hypothetical protein